MKRTAKPNEGLPFDIGIVGLGIVGAHQITREAEEVIRRSRKTFIIESGLGVSDYLRTLCPDIENLAGLYNKGRSRLPTYRMMAATVVEAALDGGPVCLAAYGHPWIYCYPTTLIERAAELMGLKVEVFAGVSAFDTLLVDLGRDIAFDGIQMYEATDVLLRRRPLMTDVTCIIWQPTIVGDPTYPDARPTVDQFKPLRDYLLEHYPADHLVSLVTTRTHPLASSIVAEFPLRELAEQLEKAPPVGTLYLPPKSHRPIADQALLDQMINTGMGEPTIAHRPGRPAIGPRPS